MKFFCTDFNIVIIIPIPEDHIVEDYVILNITHTAIEIS